MVYTSKHRDELGMVEPSVEHAWIQDEPSDPRNFQIVSSRNCSDLAGRWMFASRRAGPPDNCSTRFNSRTAIFGWCLLSCHASDALLRSMKEIDIDADIDLDIDRLSIPDSGHINHSNEFQLDATHRLESHGSLSI